MCKECVRLLGDQLMQGTLVGMALGNSSLALLTASFLHKIEETTNVLVILDLVLTNKGKTCQQGGDTANFGWT